MINQNRNDGRKSDNLISRLINQPPISWISENGV